MVCPFYGKNEDFCDVGCGYISPYDVRIISQFCSTHYQACQRYQYLMEHLPAANRPAPLAVAAPLAIIADEALPDPIPKTPETAGPGPSPDRPSTLRQRSAAPPPAPAILSPISPWGLHIFGLTTLLFTLQKADLLSCEPWIYQLGILGGGLGQFIVGGLEWRKKHFLGATALTAYGLFWLSLLALLFFPENNPETPAVTPAVTAYLLLWCLFSAVLLLGTLQTNRSLQWVFGSATLLFFLLAASHALDHHVVTTAAVWSGLFCGLMALYSGWTQESGKLGEAPGTTTGSLRRPLN